MMISMIWMNIKNFILKLLHLLFCNHKTESMKLQLYKNIDVVQINIKAGVTEYYFPQNVDWAGQKIDKLVAYGVSVMGGSISLVSPIDGITPQISKDLVSHAYFDLYDDKNVPIGYSVSAKNISDTCNYPLEINSTISLQQSKLVFTQAPDQDCCLLIYVFWGTKLLDVENLANHSITINFQMKPLEEKCLADVIDTYIYSQSKKVKGMYVWSRPSRQFFITLRDYNKKTVVKLLPGSMCKPPMGVPDTAIGDDVLIQAQSVQTEPMYLDCADIDFENSFVFNSNTRNHPIIKDIIQITFLY